jgi:hypothetical protein
MQNNMEDLSREIRFKCFLHSEGNNKHRKLVTFYKSIKSIKHDAYGNYIRSMVTMKHNKRELFGFNITNFKSKYINDEE